MANVTPDTEEDANSAYSPEEIRKREAASATDVDSGDSDGETNNDVAAKAEANPDDPAGINSSYTGKKNKSGQSKIAFLKKKGPLAGILVTLVAGGAGIAGLASPSLLIVHLREVLGDALNDATGALSIRSQRLFAIKVSAVGNAFEFTDENKCNLRCKFGTISDTMRRNFEAKGFVVETGDKKFGGRYVIKSLTFPSGDKVTSTAEYNKAMGRSGNAVAFQKVFDSRVAYYLNSRFGTWLKTKLGLDKLSKLAGKGKAAVVRSLRTSLGLSPDPLTPEEKAANRQALREGRFKPAFNALNSVTAKVGRAVDPVSKACVVFNSAKAVTFGVKHAKLLFFAGAAFAVLNLADQIKSGDSPDPAAVELVGNQLTQTQTNEKNVDGTDNAFYGQSATDSSAIRMDLYGDNPGELNAQEKTYSLAPSSGIGDFLSGAVGLIVGGIVSAGIAIAAIHIACGGAAAFGLASSCAEEIITAIASAVETAGAGAVGSAVVCGVKLVAGAIAVSALLATAIGIATNALASDELADYDENTVGPGVGASLHNGTAAVYAASSSGYGLHPGTTEEIRGYALDTAQIKAQNATIARYDAQNTPFDIYNQYSFLGSLARTFDVTSYTNPTVSSAATSMLALFPKAFATLTGNVASAASDATAAESKASLFKGTCSDPSLDAIGLPCDSYGNVSYVMDGLALNSNPMDVVDYMQTSNQVDDDGKAKEGSDYAKYLEYCADRTDPIGETEAAVEEDDYAWKIGLNCTEQGYTSTASTSSSSDGRIAAVGSSLAAASPEAIKFAAFSAFTMDLATQDAFDGDDGTQTVDPSNNDDTGDSESTQKDSSNLSPDNTDTTSTTDATSGYLPELPATISAIPSLDWKTGDEISYIIPKRYQAQWAA